MFHNEAVKPGVNAVSRFAYGAGNMGTLAMTPMAPFLGRDLGSAVG
jgi:hypothetical protein